MWTSSDLQMMPPLMEESEAKLKNLLMGVKVCTRVFSVMSDPSTPGTAACQSPLSMEFSSQEYWSGFPFLSTGDLPNPGIEPMSPAFACKFFITVPPEDERREWKSWLKLKIHKMKIMAPGPITSWQIDGEIVEIVTDFILGGSKITADSDCMKLKDTYSLEKKLWPI